MLRVRALPHSSSLLHCSEASPCPPSAPADDLQAHDWLAAAASLARADSQPNYHSFPVTGLDVGVPGGGGGGGMGVSNHNVPSLGGSPARPTLLPGAAALLAAPPLGGGLPQQPLLPEQQHWLAVMGSLQQPSACSC